MTIKESTEKAWTKGYKVLVVVFLIVVPTILFHESKSLSAFAPNAQSRTQDTTEFWNNEANKPSPNFTLKTESETPTDSHRILSRDDGIHNQRQPVWSNLPVNKTIRRWGCDLVDTPFSFVHIGKAGGGNVRVRIAGSAMGYDRGNDWRNANKDNHYYPISPTRNASFCNSMNTNFRIPNSRLWAKSYEGNIQCQATTPIGLALACPQPTALQRRCLGCKDLDGRECNTVYTSHNNLGSELHWFPHRLLEDWWKSTPWHGFDVDWASLDLHDGDWCSVDGTTHQHPLVLSQYNNLFDTCTVPIGETWDQKFNKYWLQLDPSTSLENGVVLRDYSPVYASLPIRRVTMVRDPWSWLISKFFWHRRSSEKGLDGNQLRCDDIASASVPFPDIGWAFKDCMKYLIYLCGYDCGIRLETHQISLEEIQRQAEGNLRNSFAVVGLLHESESFFDMISARMAYMDTSLNPELKEQWHHSPKTKETYRCKEVFSNKTFQEEFKRQLPILGVLDHLYNVAVEVNAFQLEELKQCDGFGVKRNNTA